METYSISCYWNLEWCYASFWTLFCSHI